MGQQVLFDADGRTIRVVNTVDVEPVLAAIKERSAHYTENFGGAGKYLGTVPNIIAQQWANECGAAIGTREWAQYARGKLKDGTWKRLTGN